MSRLDQKWKLWGIFCALMVMAFGSVAQASVIRDTEIEHGLLQIITPMAAEAGLNPDAMEIRVVINPAYNAFVAGDNMIYIHSGLIIDADNMLEVAGVLAHEIGHIASGHIPRRNEVVESAIMNSLVSAVAAMALSASGNPDAAVGVIAGGTDRSRRMVLARSRQDEGVADEWAITLMQSQNLSLQPLAEAMRRFAAQRSLPESRQSDYYLTHPGAKERSAVFQDHVNTQESGSVHEPQWMADLHQRIKTKLQAWTTPPKTTIVATINRSDETALYQKAIAYYRLSDLTTAIDHMDRVLTMAPQNPYYWEFDGDLHLSSGQADAAVMAYQKAIALLDDQNPDPVNLGQIYLSMGRALMVSGNDDDAKAAVKALERAHQEEPEWAFVKRQLGIAYGKIGRLAAADLILAEEALLSGNNELAVRLAKRVSSHGDATAIQKQLAADIIGQLE